MAIQERLRKLNLPNASTIPSSSLKNASVLKPEEASLFVDMQMDKMINVVKTPAAVLDSMSVEKPKVKQETHPVRQHDSDIIEYLDPRPKGNMKSKLIRCVLKQSWKASIGNFKSRQTYWNIFSCETCNCDTERHRINRQLYSDVEWWDEIVLGNGRGYGDIPSLDQNPQTRYADSITELVEHPIQLKPPDEPMQPQYIKACLTKKEQKKLRRQNRREVLKERTENNLMRVLGNDAVQDPTKMEAHVRKQIAERLQRHAVDNEERKLTREQKSAKMIRKMAEDTSLAVHVSVYKIRSLFNPAKKFKVHMNAKQLQMTGIILMLEDINVVVMEGGPKQQKFFKNLMMKRIKWSDEIAGQRKESSRMKDEQEGERNECVLIWEGIVQRERLESLDLCQQTITSMPGKSRQSWCTSLLGFVLQYECPPFQ
uniref:U4/U6 small nuclear ribonucleoprotein Prp3 n=1 Tax=Ditylenchus dipsaci TaxID=166011 RepID=A0A915ETX2_9BILA